MSVPSVNHRSSWSMNDLLSRLPEESRYLMRKSAEAEELAQKIFLKKSELMEADRRRQSFVEAIAAFRQSSKRSLSSSSSSRPIFSDPPLHSSFLLYSPSSSPFFIEDSGEKILSYLEDEKKKADEEYENIRNSMKKDMTDIISYRPSELDSSLIKFALAESKQTLAAKK